MNGSNPEAPEPGAPELGASEPEAAGPGAAKPGPGPGGPGAAEPGPRAGGPGEPGSSAPAEPPETYEEAAARIEQIIRRLDSGEASLNETLELVREGKGLIELCASELQAVAGALEELRLEELVERLEGQVPN